MFDRSVHVSVVLCVRVMCYRSVYVSLLLWVCVTEVCTCHVLRKCVCVYGFVLQKCVRVHVVYDCI
jgi:hypothetical protein